ncbi:odorant receptor 94a-like [Chrysoperla carnea]|uniref:odorant receptor 94a-like n=1 Tax=Chrysoperla carnea TaxID=189513 RepID=UPI001D096199|nr:odorant receptor 94a-like [Chrysoperla carnea]
MGLLESTEYRYESCNDFQPTKIIKKYQKSILYVISLYCALAASISISGCSVALVNVTIDPNYLQPIKGIYGEKLPYYMWSPFDVENSKLIFVCLVLYEWYNLFAYGQMIASCDITSFTILHFITLHTTILQGAMRTIRQRVLEKIDISLNNPIMISALLYLSALYYQISTLSWIGNEFTLNWEKISDAIYESEWYLLSSKNKKSLMFMKNRFRRPIFISIGKFAPLGVTSLCMVLRLSYSTFNLLRRKQNIEEADQ